MSGEVLLQSTSVDVTFSAYLASDHVSPATGKTIVVTISKNKAAFGNPSAGATNATEVANGVYYVNLSATDTGTLGPLVLRGAVATVDDVIVHYRVRLATATQTSVNAIPTTPLLAANYTAPPSVATILTTAITEAYRANGAAPTLAQFMSEVLGHLGEAAIAGVTKTVNKFDHTTPAETFTLDSATVPTTILRAT